MSAAGTGPEGAAETGPGATAEGAFTAVAASDARPRHVVEAAVLFGLVGLVSGAMTLFVVGIQVPPVPLASAAAVAAYAVLGVGYWWAFTKVPYFAAVPRAPRWLGLLWGAAAVAAIAGTAESAISLIVVSADSTTFGLVNAVSAGILEESVKGLGVLAVFLLVQRPRTLVDGFVIGATVGLGCEVVEDVAYVANGAWQAGNDSPSGFLPVLVGRMLTSISSHWVFTATFGVGLAYVFCARWAGRGRRAAVFVGCAVLAMALHTAWDTAAALVSNIQPPAGTGAAHWLGKQVPVAIMVVLAVGILGVALLVMRWARNREGEFYVTYLVRDGGGGVPTTQLHALPHGQTRRSERRAAGDRDARRAVRTADRRAAHLAAALAGGAAPADLAVSQADHAQTGTT